MLRQLFHHALNNYLTATRVSGERSSVEHGNGETADATSLDTSSWTRLTFRFPQRYGPAPHVKESFVNPTALAI
ncbi:Uncharacterized protein FWK35_00031732 [Aphis craccivora]|uniref:Uncharacterized protein n=1 Tax=Aphis craccivora TaxID=307492 RepID=A0A6G0ZLV8_APHCR|nr:Uncharacterized protein FWK35_00031732 [Aphis craccivora]